MIKCNISIENVNFDNLHVNDCIVLTNYVFGNYDSFSIGLVTRKDKTCIHHHEYVEIDNKNRYYKCEDNSFRKIILKKGK